MVHLRNSHNLRLLLPHARAREIRNTSQKFIIIDKDSSKKFTQLKIITIKCNSKRNKIKEI